MSANQYINKQRISDIQTAQFPTMSVKLTLEYKLKWLLFYELQKIENEHMQRKSSTSCEQKTLKFHWGQ